MPELSGQNNLILVSRISSLQFMLQALYHLPTHVLHTQQIPDNTLGTGDEAVRQMAIFAVNIFQFPKKVSDDFCIVIICGSRAFLLTSFSPLTDRGMIFPHSDNEGNRLFRTHCALGYMKTILILMNVLQLHDL